MLAIVEDLLDGWSGTLILVTHDRFLMERVTDQQWALLDGHLTHMPGGVDQYLRLCNATAEGEPVGAPSAKTGTFDTGAAAAAAEKPKSSGQPNGLSNAERQKLRREVSSLERKMETQRTRVEEAEAAMAQVDHTNFTALGRHGRAGDGVARGERKARGRGVDEDDQGRIFRYRRHAAEL